MKDGLWVIECWTGSIWRPATSRGIHFDKRAAEDELVKMEACERPRKKPVRRIALYKRSEDE